jgi:secreted trypsin-like serine protease
MHNNHDMPLVAKGTHSKKLAVSTMAAFRLVLLSLLLLTAPSVGETDDSEVAATIVGGQDASPGAYPFMVQWSGCGASLIWKDMLLTAAHVRHGKHVSSLS